MRIAPRVAVDTRRGKDEGVPPLLDAFAAAGARAAFFVAMGPDNSGKAAARAFTRSGFGLRNGPHECAAEVRAPHGVVRDHLRHAPECASAPAWELASDVLREEERLRLHYAAETRGSVSFRPWLERCVSPIPQIPTTLATLDELLGLGVETVVPFAGAIIDWATASSADTVITLHAEAEGTAYHPCLRDILARLRDRGMTPVPCGALLEGVDPATLSACDVLFRGIPGGAGRLSTQGEEVRGD